MTTNETDPATPDAVIPTGDAALAVLGTPLRTRVWDSLSTYGHETWEEGERAKRIGLTALNVVTQGFERGRGLILALPFAFDETVEHAVEEGWNGYQMAGSAAVALGGTYAACSYIFGKTLQKTMPAFPETTEAVIDNHPVAWNVIARAIDGIPNNNELQSQEEKPDEGYDVGPYDTEATFLGKVGLAVKRSIKTGMIFGPTPHVGVPKLYDHSEKSISRRLRTVVAESTVFFAALGAGISTLITHDSLGLADEIRSVITNKVYLYAAQAGLIGLAIAGNRKERKGYLNEMGAEAEQA